MTSHRPTRRAHARPRRSHDVIRASVMLMTAAVVFGATLVTAPPASATSVGTEAELRAAVADPTETVVSLTADIDLVDCASGDVARASAVDLLIEGNGFAVEQTCVDERIFTFSGGATVTIVGLGMSGGNPAVAVGGGGAISTDGALVLDSVGLIGNNAHFGGAIQASGNVTVTGSEIANNSSTVNGGAIFGDAHVEITGSAVTLNVSGSFGGAVIAASITVSDSDVTANEAQSAGALFAGQIIVRDGSTVAVNTATVGDAGAILVGNGGSAEITDSLFTENVAAGVGGAIAAQSNTDVTVTGSRFETNEAQEGGALAAGGTVTIVDTEFEGNSAVLGGAVSTENEQLSVVDSLLIGNTATGDHGGAIFGRGPVSVTGTAFSNNLVAGGGGGAISMDGGTLDVTASGFSDNISGLGGGAIETSTALATVRTSTLSDNSAGSSGGAITANGPLVVEASSLLGNTSSDAGGAVAGAGAIRVVNSTMFGNSAVLVGGGIGAESDLELLHVTLVDNDAPSGSNIAMVGAGSTLRAFGTVVGLGSTDDCRLLAGVTTDSAGYNRSDDTSCGFTAATDVENADDPQLLAFSNFGGPTWTLGIAEGSALIDAIPLSDCDPATTIDQRGAVRPSGLGCDIGAVEVTQVLSGDEDPGDGDPGDGDPGDGDPGDGDPGDGGPGDGDPGDGGPGDGDPGDSGVGIEGDGATPTLADTGPEDLPWLLLLAGLATAAGVLALRIGGRRMRDA